MKGSELFVKCLEKLKVKYIFCVPGASIDPIINVLRDEGPELIVCRHEQNAAFMAQAWGKITGTPGVCMVTAGPGVTNAVTAIATANVERSPLIAITGQVGQNFKFKIAHQNINAEEVFKPITKWSVEIDYLESLPSVIFNGFKLAQEPRLGAVHIAIPYNIQNMETHVQPLTNFEKTPLGLADETVLEKSVKMIEKSKYPIMFLGSAASRPQNTKAIRNFLEKHPMPVVATFEAARCISRDLLDLFLGRLGVFKNEPGEKILDKSDLVITVGYDPVEYDPQLWNKDIYKKIINIDTISSTLDQSFQPKYELLGSISKNLEKLSEKISKVKNVLNDKDLIEARSKLRHRIQGGDKYNNSPVHPLKIIHEIRKFLSDDAIVISDVGSHQYWLARNFFCFEPRHFLTSMGMQTMGISLPYAIAAALYYKNKPILSISGDGSFYMTAMDLETAVRLKLNIVHMVWEDESYNLVKIQQELKYKRAHGSSFGKIDTVKFAESFGAKGYRIEKPEDIEKILKKSFSEKGPTIISVPIDYSDNMKIVENLH